MIIAGFQELSLIDYPGLISAIVFTQGCVFRCPYCHNPELVPRTSQSPAISLEEILTKLRRHRNMIEGVCITGGEPTIHHDLPDCIRTLKREGFLVKLDTNGINPGMVKRLIDERLVDYFAMDLKHVWERYEEVAQTGSARITDTCKQTFELIQQSDVRHEFRTTVYSGLHTEDDIIQIGTQLQKGERYVIQPIRYGVTLNPDLETTPPLEIERIMERLHSLRPDLEVVLRA